MGLQASLAQPVNLVPERVQVMRSRKVSAWSVLKSSKLLQYSRDHGRDIRNATKLFQTLEVAGLEIEHFVNRPRGPHLEHNMFMAVAALPTLQNHQKRHMWWDGAGTTWGLALRPTNGTWTMDWRSCQGSKP